jgi:hypothetical protein
MGFLSFLKPKRKRRTNVAGFHDYKQRRPVRTRKSPKKKKKAPVTKVAVNDRLARRKASKMAKFKLLIKLLILLGLIGGASYGIFFTKTFEIQKIDVQGDAATLDEQNAVNEYLQQFLGENLLFFPSSKHEVILLDEYAHLKTLDLRRNFFNTLSAVLETYDNIANVQMNHENGSKQFFIINELGYISVVGLTDENLPTIVMDVTGTDLDLPESEEGLKVNQELIDSETLQTLLETEISFEGKFDMQIFEIHYLKRARELHLFTERYFFVWIDLTQDVEIQLAKLKKAMTELNLYEAPIEYIDLRISGQNGEKVIYKLNEEN